MSRAPRRHGSTAGVTVGLCLLILVVLGAACPTPPEPARGLGTAEAPLRVASDDGRWIFDLVLDPAPPPVGVLFSVQTTVRDRSGTPQNGGQVRVDATMPEHGHGMTTAPEHQHTGGGRHVSRGLMWHMPGRWRLAVEAHLDGRAHRGATDILVTP